jgi:beta-lactamase regulating signal transducer with metallopeptidase domain
MGTEQIIARASELLWTGALAATPVGAAVAVMCRLRRLRPSTRHLLWMAVLASFLTPAIGSLLWKPYWFRSERVMAAADSVLTAAPDPSTPLHAQPPRHEPTGARPGAAEAARPRSPRSQAPTTGVRAAPAYETWFDAPSLLRVEGGQDLAMIRAAAQPLTPCEFVGPLPEDAPPAEAPRTAAAPATPATAPEPARNVSLDHSAGKPAVAAAPAKAALSPGALRTWLVRVLAVRDSIADLPPVPLPVWFGGALFVVLLSIWRRCLGMLWLRGATPASAHVQALVRQVGDTLGLARTPRVVFVDAAVSPMIWCGVRPLLVLPTQLWRTLDEDSRRAVLVHELAHVRRWDHVMCWLVAAVSTVYWWHPVAWWARRRLHEEAEASCDAWVTDLFPGARRAYAAALVVTTSFVSARAAKRGPWLGVASGSAKRLARRITMVMTHRAAPRVSILGVCFTAMVIGVGAFVMPALACPPDEDEVKAKATHAKAEKAPKAKAGATAPAGTMFFGEAPALEAMKGGQAAPTAPVPPVQPAAPAPPAPPKAPKAPKAPMAYLSVPAPGTPALAPQPAQPADLESLKVGRTPREYHLSPGKLEAFYGMMSRGDVPILVQLNDDHIIIWGTDDEHTVFTKFIKIVDSQGRKSSRGPVTVITPLARVEGQRLGELAATQARRDAEGQERTAVSQYLSSLNALRRDRDAAQTSIEKARAEAEVARTQAQELRSRNAQVYEDQRRAAEVAANAMRERSDTLQAASRDTEQRLKDLERQLRQMEERARRLEKQLEESSRKAPKARKTSGRSSDPIADKTNLDEADEATEILDIVSEPAEVPPCPGTR